MAPLSGMRVCALTQLHKSPARFAPCGAFFRPAGGPAQCIYDALMRLFLWPLLLVWVLKWSVSAGMAMALSVHETGHVPLHTTTPTSVHHHAEHTQASPSHSHARASEPDCHGTRATPAQATTDGMALSPEGADTPHCTEHADCHHCCPLAWVNWANIGKPDAPTVHPSGHAQGWYSASWLPGLRPPKA